MEHQSGPAFTTEDTIVAIILSMRALGLQIILSPDFQQQDGMYLKSFECSSTNFNFFLLS
jgi:hypothetical protein